jgi:shikimate kinase
MSLICLIGFMGAGKSTVGELLAERLRYEAIDLDEIVLERSGCTAISEIFTTRGELSFRQLESQVFKDILDKQVPSVVMTGGGIVELEENRELLAQISKRGGIVVYLQAEFSEIAERLKEDSSRPLFQDAKMALERYTKRISFYEAAASLTVKTRGKTPLQVVELVIESFRSTREQ